MAFEEPWQPYLCQQGAPRHLCAGVVVFLPVKEQNHETLRYTVAEAPRCDYDGMSACSRLVVASMARGEARDSGLQPRTRIRGPRVGVPCHVAACDSLCHDAGLIWRTSALCFVHTDRHRYSTTLLAVAETALVQCPRCMAWLGVHAMAMRDIFVCLDRTPLSPSRAPVQTLCVAPSPR